MARRSTIPTEEQTPKNRVFQRGFTLVEVVFAISILALVMTVGYQSLLHLLRMKQSLDEERSLQHLAGSIMNRMSHELELAYGNGSPLMASCDNQSATFGKNIFLKAQSDLLPNGETGDSVTFLAPGVGQALPDGIRNTGAVQITYRTAPDPDAPGKYALVRDEVPVLRPLSRACEKLVTFSITNNLVGLKFLYFDAEAEQWRADWGESVTSKLPKIIQIQLVLRSPKGTIKSYITSVAPRS